jgi:hypothetical protein
MNTSEREKFELREASEIDFEVSREKLIMEALERESSVGTRTKVRHSYSMRHPCGIIPGSDIIHAKICDIEQRQRTACRIRSIADYRCHVLFYYIEHTSHSFAADASARR